MPKRFARLSQLKVGDTVHVDSGFTCMEPWGIRKVCANAGRELYINCTEGRHYLDGQVLSKDDDSLVGIYKGAKHGTD